MTVEPLALLGLVATIVLGILGVTVSLIIYYRQRTKKLLSCELLTNSPVVSVTDVMKDRIKITLDGMEVSDIRLVVLRVINDGNLPIQPSQFEGAVLISLGEGTTILSFEVLEKQPENLSPYISSQSSDSANLLIKPLLLNVGDWFTIRLLATGFRSRVAVDARVSGIKQIAVQPAYLTLSAPDLLWLLALGGVLVALLGVLSIIAGSWRDNLFASLTGGVVTGIGLGAVGSVALIYLLRRIGPRLIPLLIKQEFLEYVDR